MYIAMKIFNPRKITLMSLSGLSRGEFSTRNIEEMEMLILEKLNWNVYPPTAASYVHIFISLMPPIRPSVKNTILQRACFFSELALFEYAFITERPSTIALAAVLNSIDGLDITLMSLRDRCKFISDIEDLCVLDKSMKDILRLRECLWELYTLSDQYEQHDVEALASNSILSNDYIHLLKLQDNKSNGMSPVDVSSLPESC